MSPIEILVLNQNNSFVDEIKKAITSLNHSFKVIPCASMAELMDRVRVSLPVMIVSEMQFSDGLGANVAEQLVSFDIPILFVSDHEDDAIFKSIEQYLPTAYLVKPIPIGILKYTIALALRKQTETNIDVSASRLCNEATAVDEVIFVRSNNLLSKVLVSDILYVSTEGNYSIIHAQDKRHVVKVSLTNMKDLFDANLFFQVHRSYLVQIDKIDTVNLGTNELMVAGQTVPIGRKYKDELLNALVILK
jgi:DNA-binding LytR/AlgR family response regulator